MARSLALPRTLTNFPRISLSTKIQTSNLQPFTDQDLNNRSNIYDGTFNFESFYASLLDKSTCRKHLNQIYSQVTVSGFQCNGFIITKFIHVSSNIGEISYARKLFDEFPEPYVFLWNAIIRGYSKQNMFKEAITLYNQMQTVGVRPDCFTLPHVLKACGGAAAFEVGRAVHGQIFRRGFEADVFVQNGVVAVYAKCGRIDNARVVFEGLGDRTVVSWTSIISAYAQNGQPVEALRIFKMMRKSGLKPDWITLVSGISAYADIEDLGQGKSLHSSVIKMGLEFEPDLRIVLTTLYADCSLQLSNLYASVYMWSGVARVRVLMKERGLSKDMGCSMIEIEGKLHVFRMGDRSHPRSDEIFEEHKRLERRLKEAGFVADTESALHDLSCEDKEESLYNHSERLAIAYGLITTPLGATLRITKNLRACVNCHSAIKLISRLEKREIVVRDANRFHHFKDGECSCGDYW